MRTRLVEQMGDLADEAIDRLVNIRTACNLYLSDGKEMTRSQRRNVVDAWRQSITHERTLTLRMLELMDK